MKLRAETIFLKDGDPIYGKIIEYSDDMITVESLKGDGVQKIMTEDINLITFEDNMENKYGIGYEKKELPPGSSILYLKNGDFFVTTVISSPG